MQISRHTDLTQLVTGYDPSKRQQVKNTLTNYGVSELEYPSLETFFYSRVREIGKSKGSEFHRRNVQLARSVIIIHKGVYPGIYVALKRHGASKGICRSLTFAIDLINGNVMAFKSAIKNAKSLREKHVNEILEGQTEDFAVGDVICYECPSKVDNKTHSKIGILMQYANEGDLISFCENHDCPNDFLAKLAHGMTVCVYKFHSYQLVHLDLKLDNFLVRNVDDNLDVLLADFDLSGKENTVSGRYGTSGYMAPEVCYGFAPISQSSDIWALGCTIVYLFNEQSAAELKSFVIQADEKIYWPWFRQHLFSYETHLRRILPEYNNPSSYQSIAYCCLNMIPEDRPSTKEVLQMWKNLIEGENLSTPCSSLSFTYSDSASFSSSDILIGENVSALNGGSAFYKRARSSP